MKHRYTCFLILTAAIAMTMAACQGSLEEKAAYEALMYTKKNCPVQLGENITLDSMTFEAPTHTLHYYYTMSGVADSVGLLDNEVVKKSLLSELRNATSMMAYKEAGYQFVYTYNSQKSPETVLLEVILKQEDYEQK